jgi:hypothetical protein
LKILFQHYPGEIEKHDEILGQDSEMHKRDSNHMSPNTSQELCRWTDLLGQYFEQAKIDTSLILELTIDSISCIGT